MPALPGSVYGDVAAVFDNGPVKPKKTVSAGRQPKGTPLEPLHTSGRQDSSWLDDSVKTVSEAQELFEKTMADWEHAVLRAKVAQERIDMHRWAERALDPAERHDFIEQLSAVRFADAAWDAHERARDRYFRLLNEFAELEKPGLGLPDRGGLADPGDPYAHGDDGSLAWVERQVEKARRDRRHDGPARGFALD